MTLTLTPLSKTLFHYCSGQRNRLRNLHSFDDADAPPLGFEWVRGPDLAELIFTEGQIDVRPYGPWLSPGTPMYLAIPEGKRLPFASRAPADSLQVDRGYLDVIVRPEFAGSYRISESGMRYSPPPDLVGEAYEYFGHHLASCDERIQIGHRAVPVVSATDREGLLLPIRLFEEAHALGFEVHGASALTPEGLLATDFTIIDPENAKRRAHWLASVPQWSRITYASDSKNVDECLGVPLGSVPDLIVPRGHWRVWRENLLLPDRDLQLRAGADPIQLGGDCPVFLAEPWQVKGHATSQDRLTCDFNEFMEVPRYLTNNIVLEMHDLHQ